MDTAESVRALQRRHINMMSDEQSLEEYIVIADEGVDWNVENEMPDVSENHQMGYGLVGAVGGQQKWQMLKLNPLNAFMDPARVTQSMPMPLIQSPILLTTEATVSVPSARAAAAATTLQAAQEIATVQSAEQELPSPPHEEIRFLDTSYFEDDRVANFRSPHQQTSRDRLRSLDYALQLLREGKNVREVSLERPGVAQPSNVRPDTHVAPSEKIGGGPVNIRRHGPRGGFGLRTKPLELRHPRSGTPSKTDFSVFELIPVREETVPYSSGNHRDSSPAQTHQYLISELKAALALAPGTETKNAHTGRSVNAS
jgi:hypothetical protein